MTARGNGGWHLAQLNIGRMLAPIDHPLVAEFVDLLEPVNAIADDAPGFVWRLQTEAGDATSIHLFDDELLLINYSIWDSVETLKDFVYSGEHRDALRRRSEWFEKLDELHTVLWWVPAGEVPPPEAAVERLTTLRRDGPTPEAFDFKTTFPAPVTQAS